MKNWLFIQRKSSFLTRRKRIKNEGKGECNEKENRIDRFSFMLLQNQYLRFLAASAFFLRFTLGFS
jgi:hypothetical protein